MFTGIVEEVGRIITADRKGNSARLKIEAEKVLEDIKIGDSIAVNGICPVSYTHLTLPTICSV